MEDKGKQGGIVISSKCKTDIEMLTKVLEIHIVLDQDRPRLRPQELQLMVYYIKYGYTKETMERYSEFSMKKTQHIRVLNQALRDKGYLLKSIYNNNKSELSPPMKKIREAFVEKGVKTTVVMFSIID